MIILGEKQSRFEALGHALFWTLLILIVVPLAIMQLVKQALKSEDDDVHKP